VSAAIANMRTLLENDRIRLGLLALSLVLVALGPFYLSAYWERVLIFVFFNIALASSWNVIGGIAGYPSFGHGVFFGMGAYTCAILIVRGGLPFPLAMLGGGAVAGLFALLFIPLFRQRGFYFALSTLAAQFAIETVVRTWSFTRGLQSYDQGWNLPDLGSLDFFYWLTLGLLLACIGSIVLLLRTRVGLALRAIHKDEVVAASVGIPCTRYKAIAFVFSAVWPGIMGAAYAPFLVFISTENVFNISITLNMILIAIFGGIGTIIGPIIGGLLLSIIDRLSWAYLLQYHTLIYGLMIIAVISFRPAGIASWFRK
jgi:branched-chain amino acid transport system permease protein